MTHERQYINYILNNTRGKLSMDKTEHFIVDCSFCKMKVAAEKKGCAEDSGIDQESGEPFGRRLMVGICPTCHTLLAGESQLTGFMGYDGETERWSEVVRIHPNPPKSFDSHRIPYVVESSLMEAYRCLQVNASTAACVMMGRALEAVCRDILQPGSVRSRVHRAKKKEEKNAASRRPIMLAEGIKRLKERKVIDERLFRWSQELKAFRNLAAHPVDTSISRQDAEDLQTFVYAIVEYIYDLTDRYEEFNQRHGDQSKKKT
jgi:hypothetical protein